MDHAPALVPELLVESVAASLDFWCRLCRFDVLYERPEEGFAYVVQGGADPGGYLLRFQASLGRRPRPVSGSRD